MTASLSNKKNLWWFTTNCWMFIEGLPLSEVEQKNRGEPDLRKVLSFFNSADFFRIFFGKKMLGVLGLTNAFLNFFRVAYMVRDASPKKKKIYPKTRLFLFFLACPGARPQVWPHHRATPPNVGGFGLCYDGGSAYATMAHPPTQITLNLGISRWFNGSSEHSRPPTTRSSPFWACFWLNLGIILTQSPNHPPSSKHSLYFGRFGDK